MKRFLPIIGIALCASALILGNPAAQAGRIGGPMTQIATVPPYESVFFDIDFSGGQPGIVSVNGNGATILHLLMYDGDGHNEIGAGNWDRKAVGMNVYRAGTFRIEVRNMGGRFNTFVFNTN